MKTLISADEVQAAVAQLAATIENEYRGKPLTIVGVLTGSLMLLADLVRHIDLPLKIGLIQASSYRGKATRAERLAINVSLTPDLTGRHVLLIDDIFDTGHTLAGLLEQLSHGNVASLKSAVLLWKEGRQEVEIVPDHHCFKIPDQFVVGYGLDYDDEYRNLPYVAVLEEKDCG
ncbi:MAG: hypoxanthine phosphoribosyltransferase [Planctomycetota bacterium]|nr:hypoxanthine phosphoribosyltransferase [Planctomycetaceae bacterium]MDQ3331503.1 hypoxanthine phosphoribosyltransferase [Planctomycetota bacterium]